MVSETFSAYLSTYSDQVMDLPALPNILSALFAELFTEKLVNLKTFKFYDESQLESEDFMSDEIYILMAKILFCLKRDKGKSWKEIR
mmetsp:Transcript_3628/g.2686  ORF Transcript_3628/g.2686 Transcript_3628/m.2686 type:complete len:87 (-) Transcript_3628:233-493(-)